MMQLNTALFAQDLIKLITTVRYTKMIFTLHKIALKVMTNFMLGLLIGVVLGRLFDLWVDWKYKK